MLLVHLLQKEQVVMNPVYLVQRNAKLTMEMKKMQMHTPSEPVNGKNEFIVSPTRSGDTVDSSSSSSAPSSASAEISC